MVYVLYPQLLSNYTLKMDGMAREISIQTSPPLIMKSFKLQLMSLWDYFWKALNFSWCLFETILLTDPTFMIQLCEPKGKF